MNLRLVILLTLMVAVPLAVLGWLGVRLHAAERAAAAGFVDQLFAEELRGHARTIASVVDRYEREIGAALDTAPLDPPALRELLARSPLVTQYFTVDSSGSLAYPVADANGSAGEQEFLDRTRDIWRNGELTAQSAPDQKEQPAQASVSKGKGPVQNVPTAQRAAGWYVWHWGSDIHLLAWKRRADGVIVGAEINRARLVADVVEAMPAHYGPIEVEVYSPAPRIELRNSRNDLIYSYELPGRSNTKDLRVTVPLEYPLQSWSLAYLVNANDAAASFEFMPFFWYRMSTQLGAVAIALLFVAVYVYRENVRTAREAAQRVTFVNQVSHELKTPLTNIRMYAEMLEDNLDQADERSKRHVNVLVSESRRLSRMIANILTFSREERHTLKLRPAPGCVDACVRAVLDQFRPVLDARGIAVTAALRAELPAMIDADAIEQIAGNLVSNVEKYAASGKSLAITTTQTGDTATIVVADAGPGIAPKEQARIFDPFYRVSDKLTDGVAGTGIGLTIARELARLHGGDLALEPSPRGARFRATLHCPRTGGPS